MPSIIPGYEYDIFISYRQNDNQEGWVTEFVESLQREIKSIFKEEISIYYDSNPQDGLHETHDVGGSLKEKTKCLVFIPIVSQTYCDPNSFAWQNEFLSFLDFASSDKYGMDVKLTGGNVAKRILPVRIHEIDDEDKNLLEKEMKGVLRPVDFIFAATGVNRPLTLDDLKEENLKKTRYKDQINKVAYAIKDLLAELKTPTEQSKVGSIDPQQKQIEKLTNVGLSRAGNKILKWMVPVITILAAFAVYFLYGIKENSQTTIHSSDKSVAVLYFDNMSGDPEQEYFSDGITEEIIARIAKIKDLRVISRNSAKVYKGKALNIKEVAEELNVSAILEGSVRRSGNTIRVTAQLIDATTDQHVWAEIYERELTDVFKIQTEIALEIAKRFETVVSPNEQKSLTGIPTTNQEAYEVYFKAKQAFALRDISNNNEEARLLFKKAIELDPNYSPAYSGLARALVGPNQFSYDSVLNLVNRAIELDPENGQAYSVLGQVTANMKMDWQGAETAFKKSLELNPNDAEVYNFAGDFYSITMDYPLALEMKLKAMELDPLLPTNHGNLAKVYFELGEYNAAIQYATSGLELANRLGGWALAAYGALVLSNIKLGKFAEAKEIINKYDLDRFTPYLLIAEGKLDSARASIAQTIDQPGFLWLIPSIELGMFERVIDKIEEDYADKNMFLLLYRDITLPERLPNDPGLQAALDKPELNELFEIRRENLGLKK